MKELNLNALYCSLHKQMLVMVLWNLSLTISKDLVNNQPWGQHGDFFYNKQPPPNPPWFAGPHAVTREHKKDRKMSQITQNVLNIFWGEGVFSHACHTCVDSLDIHTHCVWMSSESFGGDRASRLQASKMMSLSLSPLHSPTSTVKISEITVHHRLQCRSCFSPS